MGSSYRGLQPVASFRPYTSKQVGDTGPAESTRRGNLQRVWSSFSGLAGHYLSFWSSICSEKSFEPWMGPASNSSKLSGSVIIFPEFVAMGSVCWNAYRYAVLWISRPLMRRIRIRQINTDPSGFGSTTLPVYILGRLSVQLCLSWPKLLTSL